MCNPKTLAARRKESAFGLQVLSSGIILFGMLMRKFAVVLFLLSACSHTPEPTSDSDTAASLPPAAENTVTLDGDDDRAFLEQSLELALNPWNRAQLARDLR